MNIIIKIASLFGDIAKLKKIASYLRTSPRKLYELFLNAPEDFAKKLGKLPKQARKDFSEALNFAKKKEADSANLSSSWIKKGL